MIESGDDGVLMVFGEVGGQRSFHFFGQQTREVIVVENHACDADQITFLIEDRLDDDAVIRVAFVH